jgi:hypothetical protein
MSPVVRHNFLKASEPTLSDARMSFEAPVQPREDIRAFVADLLRRCSEQDGQRARDHLRELVEARDYRGELIRPAVVEELLLFEEAVIRRLHEGQPSNAYFRFVFSAVGVLTPLCGEGMSSAQRARALGCVESYLKIANASEAWGKGETNLLEHAVEPANSLFLLSDAPPLTPAEMYRLGGAYLTFLSNHRGFFNVVESRHELLPPLIDIVRSVSGFDIPKRGTILKHFAEQVRPLSSGVVEDDAPEEPFFGDSIDLIGTLMDERTYLLMQARGEDMAGDDIAGDEIEAESDDIHPEAMSDSEIGAYECIPESDSEQCEIEEAELERQIDATEAAHALEVELARALNLCPSVDSAAKFWKQLMFETSVFHPASALFVQGYAKTGLKALQESILTLTLGLLEEEMIGTHLVALLSLETVLEQRCGTDLSSAYWSAIHALHDDDEVQELEEDFESEVAAAGFSNLPALVNSSIQNAVEQLIATDWECLFDLLDSTSSDAPASPEEMRELVVKFYERTWPKPEPKL